jgi:hypothetical protein
LSVIIVLRLVDVKERTNGSVDMTLTVTILNASYSTLGADDGFAVALILDLTVHQSEFPYDHLELSFAPDEEVGLYGSRKLPTRDCSVESAISTIHFRYLVKCDFLSGV